MGSSIRAGTMTSYYVSHANVIAHESEWQGAALLREKCGRAGQYRKQNLIARYGADIRLPELREEIAQCERRGLMHDACVVRYVDLIPQV